MFPSVSLTTLPRIGSDHTRLLFDTGALLFLLLSSLGLKSGGCRWRVLKSWLLKPRTCLAKLASQLMFGNLKL
jgi:hypothetical protein